MRIPALTFGAVLACGLAFAGNNEAVVYTAGNLTGIIPRANAVLDLSMPNAMKLRIGRTDVSVPFTSITRTGESADSTVVPAPGQRNVKPFELLTVEFNSVQGEPRTMTLEMSKLSASHVLATIHKRVPGESKVSAAQSAQPNVAPIIPPNTASSFVAQNAAPAQPAQAESAQTQPAQTQPAQTQKDKAKAGKQAKADQAKTGQQAKADKAKADKQAKADKAAADKQAKADKVQAKKDTKTGKVAKKNKKDENKKEEANNNADTFKAGAKKDAWWGDGVWKTNRNAATWDQTAGAAAAQ